MKKEEEDIQLYWYLKDSLLLKVLHRFEKCRDAIVA